LEEVSQGDTLRKRSLSFFRTREQEYVLLPKKLLKIRYERRAVSNRTMDAAFGIVTVCVFFGVIQSRALLPRSVRLAMLVIEV
jgi:hypothetical protein